MLSTDEINDFKAKLQTKMLDVAIKQAEAELQSDTELASKYQGLYRFLSLYRTAIFEIGSYTDEELEKLIAYIIHYGKLSDVVPVSFTGFTTIEWNVGGGGGITTIANVIGLTNILNSIQSQLDAINPTYTDDIIVSLSNGKSVGRWTDGQTIPLKGKTMQEGMEIIAVEEKTPTYTQPSSFLTSSIGGYVERGSLVTPSISVGFTQADAGSLKSYILKRNGVTLRSDSELPIDLSPYVDEVIAGTAVINYVGTLGYNEGITKLSTPSNTPYPYGRVMSGSIDTNIASITPILPWFYFSTIGGDLPDIYETSKIIAPSNDTLYVPSFGLGIRIPGFAIPANSNGNAPKLFTSWERTQLNKGAIGGLDNLFGDPIEVMITSTGLSTNWTHKYFVYLGNYATDANVPTTLK